MSHTDHDYIFLENKPNWVGCYTFIYNYIKLLESYS